MLHSFKRHAKVNLIQSFLLGAAVAQRLKRA